MSKSSIEWTEATWNPIVGCSIVSPGCTNCYAMKMAARIEAMNEAIYDAGKRTAPAQYCGTTKKVNGNAVWTGEVHFAGEETLHAPLRRKKPTTYFVNSMGDLFHEDCPDEWIDQVFAVMALCPQHTFQVLTKRAARMREYFCNDPRWRNRQIVVARNGVAGVRVDFGPMPSVIPLPNVWLGVSAERQQEANERIPDLLATPAAVRFISAEPLLGPINLFDYIGPWGPTPQCLQAPPELDWIIAGGESGPKARPSHPDWHRSLRDQCAAASVPFFFKQWGEFSPVDHHDPARCKRTPEAIHVDGRREYRPFEQSRLLAGKVEGWADLCRVGKKAAGRHLDGVEHNAMPRTIA